MLARVARNQGRHVTPAEAGGRGHSQLAGHSLRAGADRALGLLEVVQDALAILEEAQALGRERETAGSALGEFHTEPGLERVEAAAHHGRRDALVSGGGG